MRPYAVALLLLLDETVARALNASTQLDNCWEEWNEFWKANHSLLYSSTLMPVGPETTTYVTDDAEFSTYHTEYTTTATETQVQYLGPAGVPNAQSINVTSTIVSTFDGLVSTPWDAWAAGDIRENPPPLCSQAVVQGQQCQKVISGYYEGIATLGFTGIPAWVTSGTSTFWPTSETYAPGCTLGCQKCAIMGDKVRILYWPDPTATAVENGTATANIPLASGNATSGRKTTVFEGLTLTSPTIYISYKTLYASDSCTGIGRTFSDTIVPLTKTEDLQSLAYKALDDVGPGPGLSGLQYLRWEYEEQAFNFTDLEEPIPDEVYNQLPYCQMLSRGFTMNGFDDTSTFSCTRKGPYNPIIAVPPEVRNLDPAWATCTGWYAGLYDPPRALQGAPSAATPTLPVEQTTPSAAPIATITNDAPQSTRAPKTSNLVEPDSDNSADVHSRPTKSDGSAQSGPKATGIAGIIISAINGGESHPASSPDASPPPPEAPASQPEESLTDQSLAPNVSPNTATRRTHSQTATSHASGSEAPDVAPDSSYAPDSAQLGTPPVQPTETLTDESVGSDELSSAARQTTYAQAPSSYPGGADVPGAISSSLPQGGGTAGESRTYHADSDPPSRTMDTSWETASIVSQAEGSSHTLHFESGKPVLDGIVLPSGRATAVGTRSVSVGPSAIYIDGSAWVRPTASRTSASDDVAHVFTLSDEHSGPQTYTADSVPGHTKEVVVDGTTLTEGAPPQSLDSHLMSLGTQGVLYTVPFDAEHSTHATLTEQSTPTSTRLGNEPTSSSTNASGTPSSGARAGRGESEDAIRTSLSCVAAVLVIIKLI